ncbi:MAG: NUDIX hydrolase [Oceanicaulis sp.]
MSEQEPEAPWRTLSSAVVLDAPPWVRVRREQVETGTGARIDDFYRVEAKDFALVFARTPQDQVVMLRQWRQGPQRFAHSFPGGHVEPGEDPKTAALRELREETGWRAEDAQSLGRFSMHSNFHIGWGHFFIASGAAQSGARGDQDLEAARVQLMSVAELESALTDGRIVTVHDALCARLGLGANR